MDELITQVWDTEDFEQPIGHDLVNAFMPNDSASHAVIRKLVVNLVITRVIIRLEERAGQGIGRPRLCPAEAGKVLDL